MKKIDLESMTRQIHERFPDDAHETPALRRARILDLVTDFAALHGMPLSFDIQAEVVPIPVPFGRRLVRELMWGIGWFNPGGPPIDAYTDLKVRLEAKTIPPEDRGYAERSLNILRSMIAYEARDEYRAKLVAVGVKFSVTAEAERTPDRVLWAMLETYSEQLAILGMGYYTNPDRERLEEVELTYNAFALRWKHVRAAISRGMALGWEHAVHKSDPIYEDFQARMQGKIPINAAPMDT